MFSLGLFYFILAPGEDFKEIDASLFYVNTHNSHTASVF